MLTRGGGAASPVACVLPTAPSFRILWPPASGSAGPTVGVEVGGRGQGQQRGRALRGGDGEAKSQRQNPALLHRDGEKRAGPEGAVWERGGSSPGLWQARRSTSLKKVACSAAVSGISRSLSSCPRQLCSRHSTVSLAGQGPLARGTPSGSAPTHTPLSTEGLLLPGTLAPPWLWRPSCGLPATTCPSAQLLSQIAHSHARGPCGSVRRKLTHLWKAEGRTSAAVDTGATTPLGQNGKESRGHRYLLPGPMLGGRKGRQEP